jgi:hypothetical protein
VLRVIRRWVTAKVSGGSVRCAPLLTERLIGILEETVALAGPRCPVLNRIAAENMRSAGVYSRERHREYFRNVGGQFAGWLHVFRRSNARSGSEARGMPPSLTHMAIERFHFDETVERLKTTVSAGNGVILMSPHIANPPMWLARLCGTLPITAYVRFSKDESRHQIKERAFRTLGLEYVMEPSDPDRRGSRISRMADVLRQGRVMLITPDLPRKRDEGKPVRFFGREMHLPSGGAVLSVLSGAPLMMMTARASAAKGTGPFTETQLQGVSSTQDEATGNGGTVNGPVPFTACLTFHGPFVGRAARSSPGSQEEAILERMQWFADGLEAFLIADPPLWFLWADNRWTRVFRGDPEYVRWLEEGGESSLLPFPAARGGAKPCGSERV